MFLRRFFLTLALVSLPIFGWFLWHTWSTESTVNTLTAKEEQAGASILSDLQTIPSLPLTEDKDAFTMKDETSDGISIQFANQQDTSLGEQDKKDPFTLSFPKDYTKPLEVKLDKDRSIQITDQSKESFSSSLLATDAPETPDTKEKDSFFTSIKKTLGLGKQEMPKTYLSYQSDDERKTLLYAYQKDQGTGEKKLKHWTLYQKGNGLESESYKIEGAKVRIQDGVAQVFYFGDQDLKNQQAQAQVEPSLMERAQRTLAKEMGADLLNSSKTPDFTIPKPYYIDREGTKTEAEWKWDEEKHILSLSFSVDQTKYPIALDPTLSFTAPGMSNTGDVITGESNGFSNALVAGDFNADGKIDLVVSDYGYSGAQGRIYMFYGGAIKSESVIGADVSILGVAAADYFGGSLVAGDFNADGKTDLAVGAGYYMVSDAGGVFIFFNDGSYPTTASSADVILTGNANSDRFGERLAAGDFNADGRMDIAVAAHNYSTVTGRVYIFYNDGSMPTTAGTADVTITGETTNNRFGVALAAGDFNADGKTDLLVGADQYNSNQGRAYIFYNDGSIPTTAATADVTITGAGTNFGITLAAGDFNADGRIDLVVCNVGNAYVFYNDGSIPTTAGTADVTVVGSYGNGFGQFSVISGDFNADGRTDFAVGAYAYAGNTGCVNIFYNDGSIPTTAGTADVIITGETSGNQFSGSLVVGDFNADGKTDLAVGATQYANTGRVYIFYSQNGQVNTNQNITGEATNNYFGSVFAAGDFNADGRTDLAVGAYGYSTETGRTYIFYNDGAYPTTAATADVTITGEGTNNDFGSGMVAGDFNADGKTDLAVGAQRYSSYTGRAYIFYNDGSIPTTAATADVTITGESGAAMGYALAAGDMNADGKTDLVVGGHNYSSGGGRAYIFYNDGSIPTTAATADVIITGESISYFGISLTTGDFNTDGKTDLAVGACNYSGETGRTYIFYSDGSIPTTAATADVIITGEGGKFSLDLTSDDFNADGKIDLAVGAPGYSSNAGRAYIFYNDGSIPTTAATADVIITGDNSNKFGDSLAAGDMNADGRTDLIVGGTLAISSTGQAYIFYSDGSIATSAANADVIIMGQSDPGGALFGSALVVGDFNSDGRADLVVGANNESTATGRVYFYETRENFAWKLQTLADSTGLRTGTNGTGQEMRITGETSGVGYFGRALATGDFNADGKVDLAVGAKDLSSDTGYVYIFYSDGSLSTAAASADVKITGAGGNRFGVAIVAGDFNADGKTDVASAGNYSGSAVYIFYNDGSYPATTASADVTITNESGNDALGTALVSGDFNADGKTDLAVSASDYSAGAETGRTYIFYNDGSYPSGAASADVIITGESTSHRFGHSLAAGDFNADGKIDLAVGAQKYSSNTGRAYIFYNDGAYPSGAASADVIISGEGYFGSALGSGDFNADGRIDLVVGANSYSFGAGRTYIFYNDGSIPTTAATADVIIAGTSNTGFGGALATGDFNADGKTDLAVGGSTDVAGNAYIFYNDGSYPGSAASADVITSGETTGNAFGYSLTAGDFNADGKTDLVVAAVNYSSNIGRAYLYTFNDSAITGEATSNYFGTFFTSGDFNTDGKIDLVVGASGYSSDTGRVYIFYSDGSISPTTSTADVIITGESASNFFGRSLAAGDFNADGKTDLAAGAFGYSTNTGRSYIFYNDGSIPTTAATADVIITGEATNDYFGLSLTSGDFNTDGKTDLVVGAYGYSFAKGRVYMFYNDGSIPTAAASADAIITGRANNDYIGFPVVAGDFNADGRTDIATNSDGYSLFTGRVCIFYNDGSYPATTASADVTITGEAVGDFFGVGGGTLAAGDFNADGRTDLAVGASAISSSTGRAYIFYNDGSIPTTAATADIIITGEATSNLFGYSLASGDWNADGKTDLAVGADGYSTNTGRAYLFYNGSIITENASGADVIITGEATSNFFGRSFASGDWNADGKTDLAIGARGYSSNTGRVYIYTTEAKVATPEAMTLRGTTKFKGTVKFK